MQGEAPKHHVLISGTGRAGTSFLVKFLTELGLDTTLARQGTSAHWDEHAEAGLEQAPFISGDADLPYVIKSPATAEILSTALSRKLIVLDALIVPVRRLAEAATSRCVLEMRALHEHQPWRTELDTTMPTHGQVAGGVLYSLHPFDQARMLATALHDLLLVAVEAEVPVFLAAFPRLTEDWAHLWRSIRGALPAHLTDAMAEEAHRKTSQAAKVRVTGELERERGSTGMDLDLVQAENIALRREIRRLREQARVRQP